MPIILFVAPPFLLVRSWGIKQFSVVEIPKKIPKDTPATVPWTERDVKALADFLTRVSNAMIGIGLPLGAMSVLGAVLLLSAPAYSVVGVGWAVVPVTALGIMLFFLSGMIRTAAGRQSSPAMLAFGFLFWLLFVAREEPTKESPRRLTIKSFKFWRAIMPPQ